MRRGVIPADRRLDWLTLGVLAATAVPLLVALVSVGREHWYPTGDMAQAELHVRGFFGHPPLVGAAGRIGDIVVPYGQGSHPGPALWVALLPFYLITGRASFGLVVGMTVVQAAFIALTVWLARRLAGPLAGLLVAASAAVLVHSFGPATFIEPWNPWPALFAFYAFLVASWGVLAGRPRWLIVVVFTGVFAVQCHTGYVPLVGVGMAVAGGTVLYRWWRQRPPNQAPWWWASVGLFMLMWVPPVVDQLRREPGNLRLLIDHFTSTTEPDGTPRAYVGLGQSLKTFAGELSLVGPWLRGPFRNPTDHPAVGWFLLTTVAVGGALWLLWRSAPSEQRRLTLWLFATVGGLMLVGIAAMSRIFGEFFGYVIRWWWVLVAALVVAAGLAVARLGQRAYLSVVAVAVALSLWAAAAAVVASTGEQVPARRNSRIVGGLADATAGALDASTPYLVRWYDPVSLGGVPYGVLLELERRGFTVGVDAFGSAGALPHRVLPESSAGEVLWVVSGLPAIEAFRERADATELGYFDVRTPEEAARSDELRAQLEARLEELGLQCLVPTIDTQYGLAPLVIGNAPVPLDVKQIAGEYDALELPVAVFRVAPFAPGYTVETAGCPPSGG